MTSVNKISGLVLFFLLAYLIGSTFVYASAQYLNGNAQSNIFIDPVTGSLGVGHVTSALFTVSGQSTVQAPLSTTTVHFSGYDGWPLRISADTNSDSSNFGSQMQFRRSGCTAAAPCAVSSGYTIGSIAFNGFGTTQFSPTSIASFAVIADGVFTDTSRAVYMSFYTTPTTTTTQIERMRVTSDGNVGIATTSPGSRLSVQGDVFIAGNITSTSTKSTTIVNASTTALSVSGLTSGNCVQASTGGFLVSAAGPCGTGGTGITAYDAWSHLFNYGQLTSATTSPIWAQAGLYASSSIHTSDSLYTPVVTNEDGSATIEIGDTGLQFFAQSIRFVNNGSNTFEFAGLNGFNQFFSTEALTGDRTIATPNHSGTIAVATSTLEAPAFVATSTQSSFLPYASSTAISAGIFCIGTDCRSAWPSGGGGAFPFTTLTNFGNVVNATTTTMWFQGTDYAFMASSTVYLASSTQLAAISDPAAPSGNSLYFYAKKIAGRVVPKVKGPSGLDYPLQASFWQNNITMWNPTTATAGVWLGTAGAGAGTYTTALPTTTNLYTAMKRGRWANVVTTTNQVLGQRNTEAMYMVSASNAGQGGFFFYARTGFDVWTNGGRFFAGMHSGTTVVSADPSALNNTVGFAVDAADNGAISFLTRSTSATKASTGITIVSNRGYDLYIFNPSGTNTYYWRIVDIVNGTEASGTATATVPANNTMLTAGVLASNAALTTATAIQLGVNKIYVETDY